MKDAVLKENRLIADEAMRCQQELVAAHGKQIQQREQYIHELQCKLMAAEGAMHDIAIDSETAKKQLAKLTSSHSIMEKDVTKLREDKASMLR